MKTAILIVISLFFHTVITAQAQETEATGQICVRAFEDINNNQIRDQGEIPIQENLIANLLDAEGISIDSALIEDSPTRSQGLICFRQLAPNTYTIGVITVAYQPTTDDQLTFTLAEGDLPVVLEFGGQPLLTTDSPLTETDGAEPTLDPTIERFVVASLGALVAMVVWVMLGAVILLVIIRPKSTDHTDKTDTINDPDALFKPPSAPSDDTYEF